MYESAFVSSLKKREEVILIKNNEINKIANECLALEENSLPPLKMIKKIGSYSNEHFKKGMSSIFQEIATRCKIDSGKHVVDLGCGVGRLAIPFSKLINQDGRFYGIDVWEDGIQWCKKNLADNSNISFHHLHAKDNYYFDSELKKEDNNFRIPFIPSSSIDLFYAISVFTHLRETDCQSYFNEINRVLKKEGVAYITCFIIDEFFFDFQKRTGKFQSIKEEEKGCYYGYKKQDYFAGFTMKKFKKMLKKANLKIISYELGSWADKISSSKYQDRFFIQKRK